MKSIDKLRASQFVGQHASIGELADEIEAEIAEKYMPRPCDMDGVPIKIGDELSHDGFSRNFIVHSYELTDGAWSVWDVANGATHLCNACRHAKPDKLKERVMKWLDSWGCSYDFDGIDRAADELCADIRGMAEEGEL